MLRIGNGLVINSAAGGGSVPADPRVYSVDRVSELAYEHNIDTLININSAAAADTSKIQGIGCVGETLLEISFGGAPDKFYEINLNTLVVIDSTEFSGSQAEGYGIGGTKTRLWYADASLDVYEELNVETYATIASHASFDVNPSGVGGMTNRLFACDYTADKYYEVNQNTFAALNIVSSISSIPFGIGGTSERLYAADNGSDDVAELNPDTLLSINTVNSPSSYVAGIGGTK